MLNFLTPVFYIRVSPQRISIRNARTGESFSDSPEVALVRKLQHRIVALGADVALARLQPDVEVVNPFGHPRTLMSDFTTGQQVLKLFVKKLYGHQWWRWFLPAPRALLHLQGNSEGGYTQVEVRAFHEMCLGAGAGSVTLWEGPELSDTQVLSRDYSPGGKVLE